MEKDGMVYKALDALVHSKDSKLLLVDAASHLNVAKIEALLIYSQLESNDFCEVIESFIYAKPRARLAYEGKIVYQPTFSIGIPVGR